MFFNKSIKINTDNEVLDKIVMKIGTPQIIRINSSIDNGSELTDIVPKNSSDSLRLFKFSNCSLYVIIRE